MPSINLKKKKTMVLAAPLENPLVPGHWSQKPWLRTIMGIIVAQGLFLFLWRCVEAIHLYRMAEQLAPLEQWRNKAGFFLVYVLDFQIQDVRNAWKDESGFFLWQGLQVVALLLGGILAGAGQKGGWQYGGFIGLANGFISLLQLAPYKPSVPDVYLYAQPFLYVVVGMTASLLGAVLWPPLTIASSEDLRKPKIKQRPLWQTLRIMFDLRNFKVHWVKSLVCAGIAAVGLYYLPDGYHWVVNKAGLDTYLGKYNIRSEYVLSVLTWLWVFLVAMVAGASTYHGWVQGIWVGLISAAAFAVISLLPGPRQKLHAGELPALLATLVALGVAGGSFGSRLLPPVIKGKREGSPRMTGV
jgi:hypothetical protein